MTSTGSAGGAATVVNAFATGRGVAFGIKARVRATVDEAKTWSVYSRGRKLSLPEAGLAKTTALYVQRRLHEKAPLRVDVDSEIPAKKGLKSSSAVAVAVARAVLRHYDRPLPDSVVLKAVAEASRKSRTSLTGAIDDAAACMLGGLVFTNNDADRLVEVRPMPDDLVALVHVPRASTATGSLKRSTFRDLAPLVAEAYRLARGGNIQDAMLVNTLAYAPRLNLVPRFTLKALDAGAWAAGLTGKGPAEFALVPKDELTEFRTLTRGTRRYDVDPGGAR